VPTKTISCGRNPVRPCGSSESCSNPRWTCPAHVVAHVSSRFGTRRAGRTRSAWVCTCFRSTSHAEDVQWQASRIQPESSRTPVTDSRVAQVNVDGDGQGDLAGTAASSAQCVTVRIYAHWARELGERLVYGVRRAEHNHPRTERDAVMHRRPHRSARDVFEVTQGGSRCTLGNPS